MSSIVFSITGVFIDIGLAASILSAALVVRLLNDWFGLYSVRKYGFLSIVKIACFVSTQV